MIVDHLGSKACPACPNIYGLSKDQCATLNLSLVLKNEDFQQGDLMEQRIQIEAADLTRFVHKFYRTISQLDSRSRAVKHFIPEAKVYGR